MTYVPIHAAERIGDSHIHLVKDGTRFLLILFKTGTLFSPLKIFLPFSLLAFLLGASHYAYTFITTSRFTNMSALMFVACVLIFLIGLIVSLMVQTSVFRRKNFQFDSMA